MSVATYKTKFKVTGLDCPSCAKTIETGVNQVDGVESCQLNFNTGTLKVDGVAEEQAVIERIRELGHDVVDQTGADHASEESSAPPSNFFQFLWSRTDTRLALFGAILILPGLIFQEIGQMEHWLINILSVAAMLVAGWPVAQSAWRAVKINREININVLMTIAAIGAVIIGAYTEAGMVMVLFAMGEGLEGYTASRARNSIRSLMTLQPNQAIRLIQHGDQTIEEQVNINELQIGDTVLVKPGERIPMDGQVERGQSAVNQAPITGESKLIDKTAGETVFASSINGEGVLEIKVSHLASDNTISRLIKLVEDAQEKRAPTQRFIDKFAQYYTPAVVALALLVIIIPTLLFGQPFWNPNEETFGWLYRGLALLVVACPCALVISTPVSIISAISNAARRGLLIKGGIHLETLSNIKTIAFDKTGTLTKGQPNVVSVQSVTCDSAPHTSQYCLTCDNMLALASAVERRSEHPLAQAIINEASERGLEDRYPAGEMVHAIVGKGVAGEVDGQSVLIGSHTYFDAEVPHPNHDCQNALQQAKQGQTPLMVEVNGNYLGTITVADTVRPSSRDALEQLKQAGVNELVMLTGDMQAVAQVIAQDVGVTAVKADLLPEHKVAAIEALQREHGLVAMVGDGINDAPALATAEVGIAIGGISGGTSQAMETADITLMSDDLRHLAFAVRLSQATKRTIGVNIWFSIGIKLLFLVLVLFGVGTMWMAVLADVGTSLLVTLNGMRLSGYER
ncbi:cation-translocating P-type ATPase [Anaerolineales bacterium HSG24]|nr:cation-translocating P-type ATPase [Anaerolineales bacterium HSG24]